MPLIQRANPFEYRPYAQFVEGALFCFVLPLSFFKSAPIGACPARFLFGYVYYYKRS
jgi:hypothetical protein